MRLEGREAAKGLLAMLAEAGPRFDEAAGEAGTVTGCSTIRRSRSFPDRWSRRTASRPSGDRQQGNNECPPWTGWRERKTSAQPGGWHIACSRRSQSARAAKAKPGIARSGRQPQRPEGSAAAPCRPGQAPLYRPSLQHPVGVRAMRRQSGARAVARHDVAAVGVAAGAPERGWIDLGIDRRQRGTRSQGRHGRGVGAKRVRGGYRAAAHAHTREPYDISNVHGNVPPAWTVRPMRWRRATGPASTTAAAASAAAGTASTACARRSPATAWTGPRAATSCREPAPGAAPAAPAAATRSPIDHGLHRRHGLRTADRQPRKMPRARRRAGRRAHVVADGRPAPGGRGRGARGGAAAAEGGARRAMPPLMADARVGPRGSCDGQRMAFGGCEVVVGAWRAGPCGGRRRRRMACRTSGPPRRGRVLRGRQTRRRQAAPGAGRRCAFLV